jgi:hypothetical protein
MLEDQDLGEEIKMASQEAKFLKRWFENDERDYFDFDITVLPLEELHSSLLGVAINKGASPVRLGKERYLVRMIPERNPRNEALVRQNYDWVKENPNVPIRRKYTFRNGEVLSVVELQGWESAR